MVTKQQFHDSLTNESGAAQTPNAQRFNKLLFGGPTMPDWMVSAYNALDRMAGGQNQINPNFQVIAAEKAADLQGLTGKDKDAFVEQFVGSGKTTDQAVTMAGNFGKGVKKFQREKNEAEAARKRAGDEAFDDWRTKLGIEDTFAAKQQERVSASNQAIVRLQNQGQLGVQGLANQGQLNTQREANKGNLDVTRLQGENNYRQQQLINQGNYQVNDLVSGRQLQGQLEEIKATKIRDLLTYSANKFNSSLSFLK